MVLLVLLAGLRDHCVHYGVIVLEVHSVLVLSVQKVNVNVESQISARLSLAFLTFLFLWFRTSKLELLFDVAHELDRKLRFEAAKRSLPPVCRQVSLEHVVAAFLLDHLHVCLGLIVIVWCLPYRNPALPWLEDSQE